jgi:hypothetical protein
LPQLEAAQVQPEPPVFHRALQIKGLSGEEKLQGAQGSKTPAYLPLLVKLNKGSCYSLPHQPSKMLIDNDQLFASNYAQPEVIFSHVEEQKILVETVTIRSTTMPKTGAFPLGEGMIFLSDTL